MKVMTKGALWLCLAWVWATSPVGATTTVTFWHPWSGSLEKAYTELAREFSAEHKEIRLVSQAVAVQDIDQKVLLAVAAGSGPDIAWGFPALLGRSGSFITDLAPFITADKGALADVLPRYWEAAKLKGEVLGFPIEANGSAVAYNIDLVAASGVQPPRDDWDWDAFVQTARKLTIDKNGDGKPDQWGWSGSIDFADPWGFLPYLWQAGGSLFDDDSAPKVCKANSREAVEALRYVVDLGHRWGVTVPLLGSGGIASKKVAMETAGAWQLSAWATTKGLRTDAVVLPRYREEANILLIAHLYMLKRKPQVQSAAWTFLKWFCSPENNARWAVATGYLPIRKKAMAAAAYADYIRKMPATRAFLAGMDAAQPRPFWLPTWKRLGVALGTQLNAALSLKASPEQALAAASDAMTRIIATGRR